MSANRVDSISGIDKLKDLPGVEQVTVNRFAGEPVDWRRGLQDYVIQVYGSAGDYDEILTQWAMMDRVISISYEQRVVTDSVVADSLA